jgi:hypothetical protein
MKELIVCTLLYQFYKTLDCDTSWLGHDERSEECHSVSHKKRIYYFFYFGRINFIKTQKSNYEICNLGTFVWHELWW